MNIKDYLKCEKVKKQYMICWNQKIIRSKWKDKIVTMT